jgi:hypothetical protein
MSEYTIDAEAAIASVLSGTEFDGFDAGGTARVKKVTAAQLATFVSANITSGSTLTNTTLATPTINSPTVTGETLAAGTVTVAPLTFTSGTNLTTAAAGAMEYDGTAFYATAAASARQQVDAEQFTIASANSATYNNTGLDTSTASPVFTTTMGGSTNGAVTLVAGKTYVIEAVYCLTNTGTTSHTWAVLFGGTATFTASLLQAFGITTTTANTPATGGLTGFGTGTDLTFGGSGVVCTAASTSATEQVTIQLQGTIVVANAGTLIPQMKASARPGATGTPGVVVQRGTYFRIWEMSTGATVGNWS